MVDLHKNIARLDFGCQTLEIMIYDDNKFHLLENFTYYKLKYHRWPPSLAKSR